jgi:hypothetical protein
MATQDIILTNIQAVLSKLNSTSLVRIFGQIAQAIGISIDNTLNELENTKNIIDETIQTQRYGRAGYYTDKALAYQEGDNLTIDPVTFDNVYAVIDPTKQIIVQAAFENVSGQTLTLKVARLNPDTGKLDALTTLQKSAFDSYFTTFEIPGLPVQKVSLAANMFNFNATINYLSTYDLTNLKANVIAALYEFRDTYRFNGELFINDIETYVKSVVPGIRNISLSNTVIDSVPFSNVIKLSAGYFDFVDNIDLNLTYVAF